MISLVRRRTETRRGLRNQLRRAEQMMLLLSLAQSQMKGKQSLSLLKIRGRKKMLV